VAVIGGFRSDLLITRKIDRNFGNVSADLCFVFQSRVSTKTVVKLDFTGDGVRWKSTSSQAIENKGSES